MLNKEVITQTRNATIGNLVGNAGITYWIKNELPGIPSEGQQGYIADFLFTGFMLPAILAIIFLFWFRRRAVRGEFVDDVIPNRFSLSWLPQGPWSAIGIIGCLGLVVVALPLGIYLLVAGAGPLSPLAFSMVKGFGCAIATVIFVPIAVYHGVTIANTTQLKSETTDAEV
ncbi:hypothetical protein R50073_41490 [Maricurvus nonylphenolicus]|uniref:hypothetical protein n=1 Tax=Maricurvus nonylphenolicus TaxID=1008307 RepID=UPI0036F28C2D